MSNDEHTRQYPLVRPTIRRVITMKQQLQILVITAAFALTGCANQPEPAPPANIPAVFAAATDADTTPTPSTTVDSQPTVKPPAPKPLPPKLQKPKAPPKPKSTHHPKPLPTRDIGRIVLGDPNMDILPRLPKRVVSAGGTIQQLPDTQVKKMPYVSDLVYRFSDIDTLDADRIYEDVQQRLKNLKRFGVAIVEQGDGVLVASHDICQAVIRRDNIVAEVKRAKQQLQVARDELGSKANSRTSAWPNVIVDTAAAALFLGGDYAPTPELMLDIRCDTQNPLE